MREIKFRGKLIDIDEWVYGNYDTSIEDGDNGGTEVYYEEINTLLTYINSQLVYPETVGQYTGLKDRKGRDIFEGDIVAEGTINYVVAFYAGAWRLKQNIDGDTWWKSLYRYVANFRVEVIGNVYENPEFMKEDE